MDIVQASKLKSKTFWYIEHTLKIHNHLVPRLYLHVQILAQRILNEFYELN